MAQKNKSASTPAQHHSTGNKGIPFTKNIVLAVAVLVFLIVLFKENSGYEWVWNSLVTENLKFINKNRSLSDAQKMQAKFGVDAAIIDYIKQNTPEDAVILFPPQSVLLADSASYQFTKGLGGIKSRNWTLDFLYPRKLVYFDEKDQNPFFPQLTHTVVMDGWGYQFLDYEPATYNNFDVLPLKKN